MSKGDSRECAATVTVVGAGYVGLTTAACLAHLGHHVHCVDVDPAKIERLRAGHVDLLEPDLSDLVEKYQHARQLSFHHQQHLDDISTTITFLCVPTPGTSDGSTDMTALERTIRCLRQSMPARGTVVVKSTVPPGTNRRLHAMIGRNDIAMVSNPEFLREGNAVRDFLNPDRIIIGSDDRAAVQRVADLYTPICTTLLLTDAVSAETIKYAANTFLAMKLAYANSLTELCEHLDADVDDVLAGIGHDSRIGTSNLRPGPGWGGPCLPKDTHAMLALGRQAGCELPLVQATLDANGHHQDYIAQIVESAAERPIAGCQIGILGLTFKTGTNDLRDSPALAITARLVARHARVTAYDPSIRTTVSGLTDHLEIGTSATEALTGCDIAVVLTDWPEFTTLPWRDLAERMRGAVVVDTRRHLDHEVLAAAGLRLRALGRSIHSPDDDARSA